MQFYAGKVSEQKLWWTTLQIGFRLALKHKVGKWNEKSIQALRDCRLCGWRTQLNDQLVVCSRKILGLSTSAKSPVTTTITNWEFIIFVLFWTAHLSAVIRMTRAPLHHLNLWPKEDEDKVSKHYSILYYAIQQTEAFHSAIYYRSNIKVERKSFSILN